MKDLFLFFSIRKPLQKEVYLVLFPSEKVLGGRVLKNGLKGPREPTSNSFVFLNLNCVVDTMFAKVCRAISVFCAARRNGVFCFINTSIVFAMIYVVFHIHLVCLYANYIVREAEAVPYICN